MKNISVALKAHLAQEVTTLCTCWKATLTNGTVYGFTDNTENLTIAGVIYIASAGYTPSAVATSNQFNVDNLDVQGILSSDVITDKDLMAGLWDFAEIEVFEVNYKDLTQGALKLRKGWLGEITINQGFFNAELRGMMQKLQENLGRVFSPSCDASFGDARCGVNLAPFTFPGSVDAINSQRRFVDAALTQVAGYFDYGLITWVTGLNAGLSMEVKTYVLGDVLLQLPMPRTIAVGDTYSIVRGCSKRFEEDCVVKFANGPNFRGFPHVPGQDEVLKGPDYNG